jgi:hypothetical protein
LGSFRKRDTFWICELQPNHFCGVKTSASPQIHILRINHKNLQLCDLRTGTPKKIADLRLRNEPKNLRICDLWTFKKDYWPSYAGDETAAFDAQKLKKPQTLDRAGRKIITLLVTVTHL